MGVVAAVAATYLTGGVNPDYDPIGATGYQFDWDVTTNQDGGLFWFEQEDTYIIRSIACVFTGVASPISLSVYRTPLNSNLEPNTAKDMPILDAVPITSAAPSFTVSDVRELIQPYQGIRVVCPAAGYVVLDVRREARFPYL